MAAHMKPVLHGRDHGLWAADPIRIGLSPSGLMGNCLNGARIEDISLGLNAGVLYIPSREGPPVETGETIRASWAYAEPSSAHFDWLAMRLHVVTGLKADTFLPVEPWEADPWFGGLGSSTTGASATIGAPFGGNWNGYFYGFGVVSEDDSDVVTFSTPGGEINRVEDYGWDVAGVGHIGYLFQDFDTSETGNLTLSFASGAGPRKVYGYVRCQRDNGTVTVGSMVGETDGTGGAQSVVTLTGDVPAGSGLIVVTASQGPPGYAPSDATSRPVIDIESRVQNSNLVPSFRIGSQVYPIVRDIGGIGQAGGDLDGGSP